MRIFLKFSRATNSELRAQKTIESIGEKQIFKDGMNQTFNQIKMKNNYSKEFVGELKKKMNDFSLQSYFDDLKHLNEKVIIKQEWSDCFLNLRRVM